MELSIVYQSYKYVQHGIETASNYKKYSGEFASMKSAFEKAPQSHAKNFVEQIRKIDRDFLFLHTLNSEQRLILEAHKVSKFLDKDQITTSLFHQWEKISSKL